MEDSNSEKIGSGSSDSLRQADSDWHGALEDPFRSRLLAAGDDLPQRARACAEPLRGEPAYDPQQIDRLAGKLALPAEVRFPHPLLERVVRVGLAHIDATFVGDHPKYGVGTYAAGRHDTFPPVIIAVVDALTLWQNPAKAEQLFGYWLDNFVGPDGTVAYEGPSLSEYGMLLTSARRLMDRGGGEAWLKRNRDALARIADRLEGLLDEAAPAGLLGGVPEDDERHRPATYFHNNAWVVRGLEDWADVVAARLGRRRRARKLRAAAGGLRAALLEAVEATWPTDPDRWWLRPTLEAPADLGMTAPTQRITQTRIGSYTNYRYWPELLSSGVLGPKWMRRIVRARLGGGGQFCGMTRFGDHLDDWPLAEWLAGLWALGMTDDYRICLWGHIYYHQAQGHLTAYEQVSFGPGRKVADYCLPCQLVAVRAARGLL